MSPSQGAAYDRPALTHSFPPAWRVPGSGRVPYRPGSFSGSLNRPPDVLWRGGHGDVAHAPTGGRVAGGVDDPRGGRGGGAPPRAARLLAGAGREATPPPPP